MLQQMQSSINALTEAMNKGFVAFREEIKEERKARKQLQEQLREERDAHLDTIKALQAAVEALDRARRENNLIMFGVPESSQDVSLQVTSLLQPSSSALGANLLEVRRLGRAPAAGAARNARPRPVLVKFSSLDAKHRAFSHSSRLREEHRITMDDDLTENQRASRERQRPQFKELQDKGLRPFWRGDVLKTRGPQGQRASRVNPTTSHA
jgi:hypothetical protein